MLLVSAIGKMDPAIVNFFRPIRDLSGAPQLSYECAEAGGRLPPHEVVFVHVSSQVTGGLRIARSIKSNTRAPVIAVYQGFSSAVKDALADDDIPCMFISDVYPDERTRALNLTRELVPCS